MSLKVEDERARRVRQIMRVYFYCGTIRMTAGLLDYSQDHVYKTVLRVRKNCKQLFAEGKDINFIAGKVGLTPVQATQLITEVDRDMKARDGKRDDPLLAALLREHGEQCVKPKGD